MKLSCLQEKLSKGLGIVSRAVATRSTLPITQNILLVGEPSRLKVSATNLEIATTSWVGAKVEEEGSITIPARLLVDFVNSLPSDLIEITLPPDSHTLELKSGHFQAHINGIDAQDFPPTPEISDGITASVKATNLREGIKQVTFTAAMEESRPVLTGINTEFDKEQLTLVAADGFRLAVHKTTLSSPIKEPTTVIIPARTFNEVNRILGEQEEPVEITINQQKSQILFHLENAEIVSQLIPGSFPNYSQIIPQSYNVRAVVGINEFIQAIKASSIFARDSSGIVRLVITPGSELSQGKITVSAQAEEVGGNVSELDSLVDGEEAKIAFNVRYLSDVLSAIPQAQVAIEITNSSSPGIIRPIGTDNYVHVIMPMFVQWEN
ncbi:MAG: DNA polymerase III subunit beta [Dehalococcoidia bacterium]|nr:DNA polymerase III subunit beta [Dehalococcoidia bacterium]